VLKLRVASNHHRLAGQAKVQEGLQDHTLGIEWAARVEDLEARLSEQIIE
jgi:hypothetical protein